MGPSSVTQANRTRVFAAMALAALSSLAGCVPASGDHDDTETPADDSISAESITAAYPAGSELRTTSALNLRTGPSTSNRVIVVMPRGATVTLLADPGPSRGFYHVEYQSHEGWASGRYLNLVSVADDDAGTTDAGTTDAGTTDAGTTEAGTTPQGNVWDPRSGMAPAGKGIWIWYMSRTGLTAAEAAQRSANLGVGWVLIKSGQDATFWSTRYNEATVREFTSRGIAVFAWPYVTPSDIPGSIQGAVAAANVPGTSGVILDVEIEFEGSHAAEARQLCTGIRMGAPGVFLGYTSFGWVGYHGTFPYSTFDRYCGDAFLPQVYWTDRGTSWSRGYQQAVDQIRAAGLTAPVWLAQSNDNTPGGSSPSTDDLNAFFDQSGPYSTLWEWPASTDRAKLGQLSSLRWSN